MIILMVIFIGLTFGKLTSDIYELKGCLERKQEVEE